MKYLKIWTTTPIIIILTLFFIASYKSPTNYTRAIEKDVIAILQKYNIADKQEGKPDLVHCTKQRNRVIILIAEYNKIPRNAVFEIIQLLEKNSKKENSPDFFEINLFAITSTELRILTINKNIFETIEPQLKITLSKDGK